MPWQIITVLVLTAVKSPQLWDRAKLLLLFSFLSVVSKSRYKAVSTEVRARVMNENVVMNGMILSK
jgi:hypothetical protein